MRSTSNEAAITAAIEGVGVARLLSYQVAAHLRSGALVPVLAAHETGDLPIHWCTTAGAGPRNGCGASSTWWWRRCGRMRACAEWPEPGLHRLVRASSACFRPPVGRLHAAHAATISRWKGTSWRKRCRIAPSPIASALDMTAR